MCTLSCTNLLLLLISLSVAAVFTSSFVDAAVAPPATGGPHYAYVQMQMIEISKIDGVEQAFHADFYMLTTWAAPLAGTPFNGTEPLSSSDLDQYFWSPQLEFINERDAVTRLSDAPYSFAQELLWNVSTVNPGYVLPPGWVWILEDQRFICDFTTDLGMQDFPFDAQYMQFFIESFAWTYDLVRVRWAIPDAIQDLVPEDLNIVGWTFVTSAQEEAPAPGIVYKYNRQAYPRLTVRTQLDRQPNYYLWKIVAGVMLLVYMCVWIFSLAVDEADRQMGTLQIFAGLVTFLFVASGDTPKVPYQTRLDVFMLWSFFNVAFMLFAHGSLYYWRECDVEDLLEERERARLEQEENVRGGGGNSHGTLSIKSHSSEVDASGIELGRVASPSGKEAAAHSVQPPFDMDQHRPSVILRQPRGSVIKGPIAHIPTPHLNFTTWRLREDNWVDFTIPKWFRGLHATRKWDAIIIPFMLVAYSIGVAIIFGRPVSNKGKLN